MLRFAFPNRCIGKADRPWPFAEAAPGFLTYLRDERGVRSTTIWSYAHYLRGFEAYMAARGLKSLRELSPALLTAFIVDRSRHVGRSSVGSSAGKVRVFLTYAWREGLIEKNLARSIEVPRTYALATLPRSISRKEVEQVIRAVDRATPVGKRDYAMLLLLVTYGLRAREVAALTLDDLDWKRERIRIPMRKGGHNHSYPLTAAVGAALIEYLRLARPPSADRHVFLWSCAPWRALLHSAVSNRASHYLHAAGIRVRRAGSHTLRHSCVQRLVDAGFGLPAIGDFIGPRVPESTQIYAKVSTDALREVALARGEGAL
jgi:site-specific recombinase XerD